MIAEIKDGKLTEYHSLLEALKLDGGGDRKPRIAAVGAGGKTSLLRALAAEYQIIGRKPMVTTTTHILKENSPAFLENPAIEELTDVLEREAGGAGRDFRPDGQEPHRPGQSAGL